MGVLVPGGGLQRCDDRLPSLGQTRCCGGRAPAPRVINTDKYAAYPPAIVQLKDEGALKEHFRSFWGAWRTIAGYEAIHMIGKGQAYGSAAGAKVGLVHRFILGLFAATN